MVATIVHPTHVNEMLMPELPKPTTKIINIPYILKVMDTINFSKRIESYTLIVTNLLDERDEDDISMLCQKMFQNDMQPHILIYNNYDMAAASQTQKSAAHLHISNILNMNSITIVFARNSKDNVLHKASTILRNFKLSVVIVVITEVLKTQKDISLTISRFLNNLSQENIVNSAVIYDNNVFSFDLYPTLKVLNQTGREYFLDLNVNKIRDFHGYRIRTPIKNDMPRVFKSQDQGESKVHGIAGLL